MAARIRKAPRKTPRPKNPDARSATPHNRRRTRRGAAERGVRIRMYRQGLGDCFLLRFPKRDGSDFKMLIDCGVILGSDVQRLRACVTDLAKTTNGEIDLLVITHEHWDHLSAFLDAKNEMAGIVFRDVWLAWTEDPADPVAREIRAEFEAHKRLLFGLNDATSERLASLSPGARAIHPLAPLSDLLGFFGAASGKTRDALSEARSRGSVTYRKPGDPPWTTPDLPGIRIYTLGPPRDPKAIKKTNAAKEQYEIAPGAEMIRSFFAAASVNDATADPSGGIAGLFRAASMRADEGGRLADVQALDQPFDLTYQRALDDIEAERKTDRSRWSSTLRFLDRYYWGPDPDSGRPDQDWRRIDDDWLGLGTELALALDNATNNTSLVLAIELVESGRVLLFPADAQAGNWLSWNDLAWSVDGKSVTATDLLRRTVFYKVGHHGSHNATMKSQGLELMESTDLVAFIPVDEVMAKKRGWNRMPLPALVDVLREKTANRVLRSDDPKQTSYAAFRGRLEVDDLFYEYAVPEQ
ncbi:MAG: hypothetical protein M5U16_07335 [Hyphomicrobium sp.]|nr:hypothetical protein [Hyphomicrobium sp.]